jgi:hypothetical protein
MVARRAGMAHAFQSVSRLALRSSSTSDLPGKIGRRGRDLKEAG